MGVPQADDYGWEGRPTLDLMCDCDGTQLGQAQKY